MIRAEVAVAAAAGGLVGAVISVSVLLGADFGSIAEWASGIGTVGALFLTYLLLRHEIETRRRDETEALWRQARQVSIVVSGGVSGTLADPTTGVLHLPATLEVGARAANASGEAIRSCRVDFAANGEQFDSLDIGVIGPGQLRDGRTQRAWSSQEQPSLSAVLHFTDAAGVMWRRHSDGRLERVVEI